MADKVLSVVLAVHGMVRLDDATGTIKHVDIVDGSIGEVYTHANGTPLVGTGFREEHRGLVLKYENPIIRHILQQASVNAMPKGSEVDIVKQHVDERYPEKALYPNQEQPGGDDPTRD